MLYFAWTNSGNFVFAVAECQLKRPVVQSWVSVNPGLDV